MRVPVLSLPFALLLLIRPRLGSHMIIPSLFSLFISGFFHWFPPSFILFPSSHLSPSTAHSVRTSTSHTRTFNHPHPLTALPSQSSHKRHSFSFSPVAQMTPLLSSICPSYVRTNHERISHFCLPSSAAACILLCALAIGSFVNGLCVFKFLSRPRR